MHKCVRICALARALVVLALNLGIFPIVQQAGIYANDNPALMKIRTSIINSIKTLC
jgi:hypothetical protein